MKKILSAFMSIVMLVSVFVPSTVQAEQSTKNQQIVAKVKSDISGELEFLNLTPSVTALADAYTLAKAGVDMSGFFAQIDEILKNNDGTLTISGVDQSVAYATVIDILKVCNKSSENYNGINLSEDFQTLDDTTVSNPYFYRLITEACACVGNTNLAKVYIDQLIKNNYVMGKGMDYYGFSCDNTAMFLATIAPYKTIYAAYTEDALKVLEHYTTAKGCFYSDEYNDISPDSTASAILAYSALGNYDKAYALYNCLMNGFESKTKNGVIVYYGYENEYSTKSALLALAYFDASKIVHTTVVDKAVPATYAKTGKTQGSHCIVCGTVVVAQKTVAKLTVPATSISKIKSPKKKQIKVIWKKNTKVSGYEIQYSTDKKFKKGNKKVVLKNNKTTSTTVKKLKSNKKYYVRIRTYKNADGKKYYSTWSKSKNIKVK